MNYRLPKSIGKHTHFVWGKVTTIHSIEALGIDIVEYHSEILDGARTPSSYDANGNLIFEEKPLFHPYVNGKDSNVSTQTLAQAIVSALAIRRHGMVRAFNDRHATFALKCLEIDEQDIVDNS